MKINFLIQITCLVAFLFSSGCGETTNQQPMQKNFFPAQTQIGEFEGTPFFSVQIEIDLEGEIGEYYTIFEEAGFYGSGDGWEEIIAHYLQENYPDFAENVEFNSESGYFFAQLSNEKDMNFLAEKIHELAGDKAKFRKYLEGLDPDEFME